MIISPGRASTGRPSRLIVTVVGGAVSVTMRAPSLFDVGDELVRYEARTAGWAGELRGPLSAAGTDHRHAAGDDPRDRALLHELVKGALRWRGRLESGEVCDGL